jgi:peroxiredoxin
VRIVVSSIEGQGEAGQSQNEYPHLIVLSDSARSLANAADVIHRRSAPDGGDSAAPTTFLLDSEGRVRWMFRPDRYIERISPSDLLAAIDQHLPAKK